MPHPPLTPAPLDDIAKAQALVFSGGVATLATLDPTGHPQASLVTFAPAKDGTPLLLLSALSTHTQNLTTDPRASLLIITPAIKGDPLALPRLAIQALAQKIPREDEAASHAARKIFLSHHPKAKLYVDFPDFAFWQLVPQSLAWNGGFGKAGALTLKDIFGKTPTISLTAT